MARSYALFIRNYRKPFPQKWRQILLALGPLNAAEHPGDENGPYTIVQFTEFQQIMDAVEGIASQETELGFPTVQIHESETMSFPRLVQKVLIDCLENPPENPDSDFYPPFTDATARINVINNRQR